MKPRNKETEPGAGSHARPADVETAYLIHTLATLIRQRIGAVEPFASPPPAFWPPGAAPLSPLTGPAPLAGAIPPTWPCCS